MPWPLLPFTRSQCKSPDCGVLLHARAPQRGTLLRAVRIVAVTVRAMVEEYSATGGDRIRLLSVRIRSLTVAGWDILQPGAIGSCERGHGRS